MKRYLLFFGNVYYPSGGMRDLLSDHDTLEGAIKAFEDKVQEELQNGVYDSKKDLINYTWANIYDTQERREVWNVAF